MSRTLALFIFAIALSGLAFRCAGEAHIEILEPAAGMPVTRCMDSVIFALEGPIKPGSLEVTLNGEVLSPDREGGRRDPAEARAHARGPRFSYSERGRPEHDRHERGRRGHGRIFRAEARAQLAPDNLLEVRALRAPDGEPVVATRAFEYAPPARAERIVDESQLITGPLAHSQVGDWLLSNCTARFIIQDAPQRDMYSVGAFGGNLIDLELVGRPGLDNFLEIAPTLDLETVVNPQLVEIVNDGTNGEPATIRSCGPDDLLDFINPSSQIGAIPGVSIPGHADDRDLPIEACTTYSLVPFSSRLKMETTVTNLGTIPFPLLVGDWINSGGELENFFTPGRGPGSGLTDELGAISWIGFGEAAGVDYSFAAIPIDDDATGSYINISGVTLSLHALSVIEAILGVNSPFLVFPGTSRSYTRYMGVGDGSGSNAIDMAADVLGEAFGRVEGCVSVAGVAAPGARVAVGTLGEGELDALLTLFTTDDDGCYAGSVPPTEPGDEYAMAAALTGHLYEGGVEEPPLHVFTVAANQTVTLPNVHLPAAARLRVKVRDAANSPIPARVTVVGFDPSPEPIIDGGSLFGLNIGDIGMFQDPGDSYPFGITTAHYVDAKGEASFVVEPGSYEIYVSRGNEYSLFRERHILVGGETTELHARIARVLETPGFISSDFHVHGIRSADSRINDTDRVMQFAGEGIDNVIMTDHGVHTDLKPRIEELGMREFLSATIGEEITTFDYGHFNGYPFTVDSTRASGGSTDWGREAPPGMDFPQHGAFSATPPEIYALATTGPQSLPTTAVQVNHIDSHFGPLKIDTGLSPFTDGLTADERTALRLPTSGNLFHAFDALELWNGESRGSQRKFLEERIGIWFNHLNHGIPITFIADTDTHKFFNLNSAGARSWTASSTDAPRWIDPLEVGAAVHAGRAVGGQGMYVQTRLLARDGSGGVADLDLDGSTTVVSANGDVDLEIDVQAPAWAAYDRIEIYANAETVPGAPYQYSSTPDRVLTAGLDFDVDTVTVDPGIPGATRLETRGLIVPFSELGEDTWFVVIVKGSDGVSAPMFPVFAENLDRSSNTTLDDLVDGNLGENGVMALGATNALYADVDGEPGFQIAP
jgi:hypothetical protein